MIFSAVFAILVGILMVAQWVFFLATKQVPEVETEPLRLGFHLLAEFVTAGALLLGGIGLLLDSSWANSVYLVALGMLFYTVLVSPGYFAQKGQLASVGMFAVVLVLALISLYLRF